MKTIIYFLLLQGLVYNLMPSGGFQKLLKVSMGMLFFLLLLRPIYQLISENTTGHVLLEMQEDSLLREYEAQMEHAGSEMQTFYQKKYEAVVEEQISEIAGEEGMELSVCNLYWAEDGSLEKLEVELGENVREIKEISLGAEAETQENPKLQKIKNEIIERYGMEEEAILIWEAG